MRLFDDEGEGGGSQPGPYRGRSENSWNHPLGPGCPTGGLRDGGYVRHMGDQEFSLAIPVDGERFMRRECPTCEREFKWRFVEDGEESMEAGEEGYHCPYCAVPADVGEYFTKAQWELVQAKAMGGVADMFGESLSRLERSSAGIEISVTPTPAPEPPPLPDEPDDMRRVDPTCHPEAPVKVLEEWSGPVHCLICGNPV